MEKQNQSSKLQKTGGIFALISAFLFLVMTVLQGFAFRGIEGSDVNEKTVNAMAAHPVLLWLLMIAGVAAMIVSFWIVEALDVRFRTVHPMMSTNVSRFGYLFLFTYSLYIILPAAVLHDLFIGDHSIAFALELIQSILGINLGLSVISNIFMGVWLLQVGIMALRTSVFSKVFAYFTLFLSFDLLVAGVLEALFGRVVGAIGIFGIIAFIGGLFLWKIWVGIELLRSLFREQTQLNKQIPVGQG